MFHLSLPARSFGKRAEKVACSLLKSKGYKIIDRNFRCSFGEIDIIALKDDQTVFVEVKARRSDTFGQPEEAVTSKKLEKITKTIYFYNLVHKNLPRSQKIEVISLVFMGNKVISSRIIQVDY